MIQKFNDRWTGCGARPQQIYIGDSTTDLSCLVRADVGIIMCPDLEPTTPIPLSATSKGKSSDPLLTNANIRQEVLDPPPHPLIDVLHACGFETRHVRDYEMLHTKVNPAEDDSPYVHLLWARNFDEILSSGMLSNWTWDSTKRKRMENDSHPRNLVGKTPKLASTARPVRSISTRASSTASFQRSVRHFPTLPTMQ